MFGQLQSCFLTQKRQSQEIFNFKLLYSALHNASHTVQVYMCIKVLVLQFTNWGFTCGFFIWLLQQMKSKYF